MQLILDWMSDTLDEDIPSFQDALKSGRRLCLLLWRVLPPSSDRSLLKHDNLSLPRYLKCVPHWGVSVTAPPPPLRRSRTSARLAL